MISEKLLKYFGYFEVYLPDPEHIYANETVSGVKIEKLESFPNQLTTNTNFNEMQKIMGFRKKSQKIRCEKND